jgi:voltage-gated potassium channel
MAMNRESTRAARPLMLSAVLLGVVILAGVVGYTVLSPTHSVLDAVYMTAITLATVGYGEAIDLSASPGGRLFTVGLILAGVASFANLFSCSIAWVRWRRPSPRGRAFLADSPYKPFIASTLMMIVIFAIGTVGYTFLSPTHSVLDAVYMTVITLTTVGYGEIIDMSDHPEGRVFTMFLLFTGVGTFVYFFSSLTGFVVEGNIERIFRRRKMQKLIAHLENHYIVSGAEFIARHIVRELVETERELVLIASSEEEVADIREHAGGAPFPAIVGDPTDDANLVEAGIARARGVFACMEADKDTLILTLSARLLNPNVKIVSRCVDEDFVAKIRKAGADQVVSPPLIGGLRMASAMVRPTVVTFLDVMLRDKGQRFRVEESAIASGSRVDGMTAGELRGHTDRSVLLMAVRSDEGDDGWVFNPPDDFVLRSPMTLDYIGNPDAKRELDRISGK